MVKTYSYNGLTWIDVESPTQSEIADLVKRYDLHPSVGEELVSPSSEAKVELHKHYVYLNLDIPARMKGVQNQKIPIIRKEVDFVVGKQFIITTKYDTIEPLHNFSRIFETNSIIDKKGIGEHAGFIFYYMLKKLYSHIDLDLGNLRDALSKAESAIFEGKERDMVIELSRIGREVLDTRQILRSHEETLELTGLAMEKLFSPNFRYNTDDLETEYEQVMSSVDNLRELLSELRRTNDSLLSSKQNEVMKNLTLMAFITFPLNLFLALFAIRTEHTPIIGTPYDFQIILGILILAVIAMLWFFRRKRWIS